MNVNSAIALVDNIVTEPGWTFEATDYSHKFENSICVKVVYVTRNANRDQAEKGYAQEVTGEAKFAIMLDECPDDIALYYKIITKACLCIKEHEVREFFRIKPTMWAPFHPHRADGMQRWGTVEASDSSDERPRCSAGGTREGRQQLCGREVLGRRLGPDLRRGLHTRSRRSDEGGEGRCFAECHGLSVSVTYEPRGRNGFEPSSEEAMSR